MASPTVDVKPRLELASPTKTAGVAGAVARADEEDDQDDEAVGGGCDHLVRPVWTDEEDPSLKNLSFILKSLQPSNPSTNLNPFSFCSNCRSNSNPRLICLTCGLTNCYTNPKGINCYKINHHSKSSRCKLGFELFSKELMCLVCGDIVQLDDNELKLLSRKLLPPVKKAIMPACLNRTTNHIFPPRGFRNLGSSCYMNVILQIILRIPELQSYLLTDHHNRLRHRTNDEIFCCACELVEILQSNSGLTNSREQISPVGFLYSLWMNSGDGEDFAGYRESDAHECLLACLNQLHSATQLPNSTDLICQCPIHLLFRCELRSELVCGNCKTISHKSDPILDLSLEIGHLIHLNQLKLSDCLENYTKSERLNEKGYTCNECGVASPDTTKSLKISQLPHILCIQLKRFEHQESGSVKLDRKVEFPLILNMKPFTVHSDNQTNDTDSPGYYYKLIGIVRHQGNAASGHYQAFVYQDEQYFGFNDGSVNILRLEEVLEIEAYILIYSFILNP